MKKPSKRLLPRSISVAARDSLLSRVQVQEVFNELPTIAFKPLFVKTTGDLDQKTPLRTLDKTDFFTKEVDALVIDGTCRIAIHAAKDLPDPVPPELNIVALTRGVDPSDVIVLRESERFETLPPYAVIGTSSNRREEMVKALREDLTFVDIRGTIEKRLEKLFRKEVDGVVMALAAIIRLKLTHLNIFQLQGETAPLQGRLAVVARNDDEEMERVLASLHAKEMKIR